MWMDWLSNIHKFRMPLCAHAIFQSDSYWSIPSRTPIPFCYGLSAQKYMSISQIWSIEILRMISFWIESSWFLIFKKKNCKKKSVKLETNATRCPWEGLQCINTFHFVRQCTAVLCEIWQVLTMNLKTHIRHIHMKMNRNTLFSSGRAKEFNLF